MEAMCHTPRERKSKSLDKIRKKANEEVTCGKEKKGRNFPLESTCNNSVGEGKMERKKRKERKRKERKER